MAIWSVEIKELAKLYESLSGKFPELEKELAQLIRAEDPNVLMLYSRRCLEVIITDLCECELNRPRKTEPLQGIIDKLNKEGKVPSHIIASMHSLNSLSTFGAHPKDFDPHQIKPVLVNLEIIIKYYLKFKGSGKIIQPGQVQTAGNKDKGSGDADQSPGKSKIIRAGLISASGLILLIIAILLFFTDIFKSGKKSEEIEKSIAVLPFKLLSDEPDKQYLADGMMDAITLYLSKIQDLRVMSRTSVEQYRETRKTANEIGKELNVEYLLEGSFQKYGDNARLIVQLIKVSEDSHAWADEFNSKWSDVFSLQSEVAQKIATELKVVLTPVEIEKMEERPTGNLEAYQAYLRGRYYAHQPHFSTQNWNLALQNYQDAVDMDTTFALAYGELAHAHARFIYLREDISESRLKKADQAAVKALRYGTDQSGVHLSLGYYYLYAYRDTEKALAHLEIAEKGLPNNAEIMVEKAAIIVILGRWEECIDLLEKAQQLSPSDAYIPSELALGYWYTRHYSKTINACDQAIALSPTATWPYLYKIFAYWSWKGTCKESRDVIKFINDKHEWYLFTLFWQEVGDGNYEKAFQLMSDTTRLWGTQTKMWAYPQTMSKAFLYDYLGQSENARIAWEASLPALEQMVKEVPADPRYRSSLGIVYASLGRKEDAVREGKKAVELLPVTKDAVYGIGHLQDLAVIYIKSGEFDLALKQIEQLLAIPSWITPVWLDWDIRFAPMRSHPGYNELLKKYPVSE